MFMIYIHALTLVWNMGNTNLKLTTAIFPAMGVLFIFIGLLIRKAKRNYFIGIRTPWTLSSDKVWDETHRLGGTLFAIAGVITLLGFFFPDQAFYVLMISILVAAVIPIIYSYLVFRREEKSQS